MNSIKNHTVLLSQSFVEVATATIPYCQGTSEAIRRVLKSVNVRMVMKPQKMKWQLMKGAKDTLRACEEPGAIYAIGCKDCAHVYVRETARTAHQRGKEHEAYFRHRRDHLSAIAAHALEEGRDIHSQP